LAAGLGSVSARASSPSAFRPRSPTSSSASSSPYGGSLFVRIFPIQQFFVIVEGELINTGWKQGGFTSGRKTYGNLLLGGGLVMGVGKGAFIATSLKIAVFRNVYYPTAFPIISIGGGYAF
jgi:hypothetical protein